MIKNKLYPYIEKYINEYLYGFTKEQLNVGVMNGLIVLDNLNIRPDRVNSKLDNLEVPIWLKAGQIGKIQMCCSLMNFLGEKPLEVTINDIDLIIGPSLKWVIKNKPTFIEENEYHLADPYDEMDNNSHNIFTRKVNIYDSSVIKERKKVYEILSDKSKISEIINKIFTKCLSFYYNKAYLINIKINNIHIRFEDDLFLNQDSDLGLGIKIDSLLFNLSAEGVSKKNSFKCDNLNFYWEPKAKILIPCKKFMDNLDRDNNIDDSYYDYLKIIKIRNLDKHNNEIKIIENFNCMGNFGIAVIESGGLDFFSKNREKNFKMFIQLATAEINMNVYPDIISITARIIDFTKSFFILEPIQDFKPMRKPYNKLSAAINKVKNDPKFKLKRKLVVRDWLFYLIWFNRFKKAIYNSSFNNPLHDEFSKYFNICCMPGKDSDSISVSNTLNKNKNNSQLLNDSNIFRQSEKDREVNNQSTRRDNLRVDDPNPENINLIIVTEFLMKGINIKFHPKYLEREENIIFLKLSNVEFKSMICKEKFDFNFDIKNILVSFQKSAQVSKIFDNRIKDEILYSSKNNYMNTGVTKYIDKFKEKESLFDTESLLSPGPNRTNLSMFSMNQNEKIAGQNLSKKIIIKNENFESSRDTSLLNKNNLNTYHINSNKNVNLKNSKIISLLLHDGEHLNSTNQEEKSKLSKIINDYNKDLIREKKSTKITLKMDKENNSTNRTFNTVNETSKLNLNLVEFYPTRDHSSNPIFSFNFYKANNSTANSENLNINLGFVRINLPDEYLINATHLFSNYLTLKKLTSTLGDEKNKFREFLNFKIKGKLNNLRCILFEKLKSKYQNNENKLIPKTHVDILDYMTYLHKNIQPSDLSLNNKYHLDQIFNLFENKNIEINFVPQEIYFIFYNSSLDTDVGQIKLPNFKFNFTSNNQTKIHHFNFFDMDVSFNDLKNLKFILQNFFTMLQEKIKFSSIMLEPVIKKILKEKNSSKIQNKQNGQNGINAQNGESKIKKIINKKYPAHGSNNNKNVPNNIIFNKNNFLEVVSPVQKNVHSCPEKFNIDLNNLNEIDSNLGDEDLQATIPFEEEELTPSDSSNNSFSPTSEIVNLENSVENLWDENQGNFPQLKKKINDEKIHKMHNYNPKSTEEENPQTKKSGQVKLQLTNSGNINLWNININK